MSKKGMTIILRIFAILLLLQASTVRAMASDSTRIAEPTAIDLPADSLSADFWLKSHPHPDSVINFTPRRISRKEQMEYSIARDPDRDWWHLLKRGYFNPHDSTVRYSKFMKLFCKVYTWGDRVFNTYDTTYVVGFGRNWKARLAYDAWTDSYNMNFDHQMPIMFLSEPYSSLGAYLHFMAVSVNYSIDVGKVFQNKPVNHSKFEFGFNCARFNAELSYSSNTGGTYIRRFGDYKNKKFVREFFPGLKMSNLNFAIYYFFNNRKYANGAAYNFSKLQKKSAGSFLLGFNYANLDCTFDFDRLPEKMKPYLTWPDLYYKFHYNEFCLLFGYGYNWVLNKHFLFNFTGMPSIGITRCYEDSRDGGANLLALNALGRMSLTYNQRDFFICLILKANLQWYRSGRLSFLSGIENLSLSIGYRF